MFTCTKNYNIEYSHQLFDSFTSLCHETIHGHSGKIQLTFINKIDPETLNKDSMVIDFGEISSIIKTYIMEKYDHALFMPKMFNEEYLNTLKKYNKRLTITDENPTAENFAKWIFTECNSLLQSKNMPICITGVTFWETETGCATYQSF